MYFPFFPHLMTEVTFKLYLLVHAKLARSTLIGIHTAETN